MGDNADKWFCSYNGVTYDSRSEGISALKSIRSGLYSEVADLQKEIEEYKSDWTAIDTFEQQLVNYYSFYSEQRESSKDMANLGESILCMLNNNPNLYVEGASVSTNIEDITSFVSTMYNFYDDVSSKMKDFDSCGADCDAAKKQIAEKVEELNKKVEEKKAEISEINQYV